MSRKVLFTHLNGSVPTNEEAAVASGDTATTNEPNRGSRFRSRPILGSPDLLSDPATTPVGAIGQSLSEFNERAKRADEIERKLTAGQVIVELDPAIIDPSFVSDRMPLSASDLAELTEAIREHGQLNPILVRPHPEKKDRFQVAFGHRRLRAVTSLGRPIKAVVRDLTDEQLVIAQGQENHERKDLSYIEKALFAHRLEQRFTRSIIMAALSVYKGDLSNMLSVANKIPQDIIAAIGPAPGVGRRGWIDLADYLSDDTAISFVRNTVLDPDLAPLTSDERFKRVLSSTKAQSVPVQSDIWRAGNGQLLATVAQNTKRVTLTIDRQKSPEFAAFVLSRLQDLYLEFQQTGSSEPNIGET